jgi:hypothetical protein
MQRNGAHASDHLAPATNGSTAVATHRPAPVLGWALTCSTNLRHCMRRKSDIKPLILSLMSDLKPHHSASNRSAGQWRLFTALAQVRRWLLGARL